MTLTAPATRKMRGYKAGFTIQPSTPAAPAAPTIGTIVVLDNYILTVPISSVPEDADYAQLLWSDTENGTYTVYQSNIPALVTTNVSVNTVTALTKWFKAKSINAYNSSLSAAVSATSSAGSSATPNQMVNLRVTAKTTTSLTYSWDALANVTSYTLQRWNAGAADWTTDQVTGITDTTYTISTLTANTEYGVRGRGVNTGAASPNGPLSAETWDFTDPITTPVPTPPTVTWQRMSSTVIRFLFADGDDATTWEGFSRSPSGGGAYSAPISLTVDQAYYDLTVSINETADFYITATNAQGSENSDIATGSAAGGTNFSQILKSLTYTGGVNGTNVTADSINRYGTCRYSTAVVEGADSTSMELYGTIGQTSFGYAYMLPGAESVCAKKGDTYWFSVRMYRPTGYLSTSSGSGNHLKFFRIRTYNTGGGNGANSPGYTDIYLASSGSSSGGAAGSWQFIYEGAASWAQVAAAGNAPVTGVWETYDLEVVFDNVAQSAGGTGRVRFWKNKILLGEITNKATLNNATSFAKEIHHSTYWNGGIPQTQSMYVNKVAMAVKIAGGRDDSAFLTTDSSGRPLIAVGL